MSENKNHYRVYMDVLNDVGEIIEKLGIEDKDNALWEVIHMVSFGLHRDFVMFLLCNEPYLEDVVKHDSFENMPVELQQTVLRSLRSYGNWGLLKITESADGKRLEYNWEEPGEAARATIEGCDGELSEDFVEQANSRGVKVIFAKNGYTEAAKALARRYWINLEIE